MKKEDLSYLKELLEGQLDHLLNQADHTVSDLLEKDSNAPDPLDRATFESERDYTLRIRDRKSRLHKCPADQRRVHHVVTQAAEQRLAEPDRDERSHGRHPQRETRRQRQREQQAGYLLACAYPEPVDLLEHGHDDGRPEAGLTDNLEGRAIADEVEFES